MPGGKIVVYEGILPVTQDEAGLAIVLGHEIAHAVAKHSAEQMIKIFLFPLLAFLAPFTSCSYWRNQDD